MAQMSFIIDMLFWLARNSFVFKLSSTDSTCQWLKHFSEFNAGTWQMICKCLYYIFTRIKVHNSVLNYASFKSIHGSVMNKSWKLKIAILIPGPHSICISIKLKRGFWLDVFMSSSQVMLYDFDTRFNENTLNMASCVKRILRYNFFNKI